MSLFKKQTQLRVSFTCNNFTTLVFSLIFLYRQCDCHYQTDGLFYSRVSCNMWALEKVFTGTLLVLVIIEFIVALTAAILTCISTLCGRNGCCNRSQQGKTN